MRNGAGQVVGWALQVVSWTRIVLGGVGATLIIYTTAAEFFVNLEPV